MAWSGANGAVSGAFLTMFTLQTGFRAFQHEGAIAGRSEIASDGDAQPSRPFVVCLGLS